MPTLGKIPRRCRYHKAHRCTNLATRGRVIWDAGDIKHGPFDPCLIADVPESFPTLLPWSKLTPLAVPN